MPIEELKIRTIIDSRGNPTVEVDVRTEDGVGRASAPAGASTGASEAVGFSPQGIEADIGNFRSTIAPALKGMDAAQQEDVDARLHELDGTENFSGIGTFSARRMFRASSAFSLASL